MQRLDVQPFGEIIQDSNPGWQPFGFGGGLHDPDTGLIRFGARDYDPQSGRWASKDPALFDGEDSDLYVYGFSDPVNHVDPEGRVATLVVGAAVGAGLDLAWQLWESGGDFACVDWAEVGVAGAAGAVGAGVFSKLARAVGPLKQWVRVGSSYSKTFRTAIDKSIRWGASPAKEGKYVNEIGSRTLQNFNQWLRSLRLPGNSWRVQDPGHFHLGPKPPGIP